MSGSASLREQARLWLKLYRDLGVEAVALPPPQPAQAASGIPAASVSSSGGAAPSASREAGGAGQAAAAREAERPAKAAALEQLRREKIGECRRCGLAEGRQHIVFGAGDPSARLMFIGEGPGADEDRIGEPFVGRAGKLLDRIIAAMGLSREQVYIANIVKCRPPGNRTPLPDERAMCLPFLQEQIRIIAPEVIVTLGRTALEGLLGETVPSITRARGRWFRACGVPVLATFHPAYLLRNEQAKRPVWEDMQEVLSRLGLEPPRR